MFAASSVPAGTLSMRRSPSPASGEALSMFGFVQVLIEEDDTRGSMSPRQPLLRARWLFMSDPGRRAISVG